MNEALRRAMVAAGVDPDAVALQAATIDLSGPRKGDRQPGPVTTLQERQDEQLGLEGIEVATGIVTIRPGTKKHESLARLRGQSLEQNEIEFLQEFIAADLVQQKGDGWTASLRGELALGMLDYGSVAKAEKGKTVTAQRDPTADRPGKYQRSGQAETSQVAAVEATPITGRTRLKVLAYIHFKGGATDEQVQQALKMNPSTQRPRRVELVEAGAVEDSGERRDTESGHAAVVWKVTEQGAEAAEAYLAELRA